MRTRTTLRGRPLHPMLVLGAIGALTVMLVLDALHVLTGDSAWSRAAVVANAVGAGALVVAVVPASIDYATSVPRGGRAWKVATTHMALGGSLVGYFVVGAATRWSAAASGAEHGPVALAFSAFGVLALTFQGYLGGTLVKLFGVGVDEGARPAR